jgi:hypothetical protein
MKKEKENTSNKEEQRGTLKFYMLTPLLVTQESSRGCGGSV